MTMLSLFLTAAAVISSIAIQAAAQAPIRCRNRKRKWVPTGQKTAVRRNQSTASRPTAIATAAYVRSSDICSPIIATANPIAAVQQCASAAMQMAAVQYQAQRSGGAPLWSRIQRGGTDAPHCDHRRAAS